MQCSCNGRRTYYWADLGPVPLLQRMDFSRATGWFFSAKRTRYVNGVEAADSKDITHDDSSCIPSKISSWSASSSATDRQYRAARSCTWSSYCYYKRRAVDLDVDSSWLYSCLLLRSHHYVIDITTFTHYILFQWRSCISQSCPQQVIRIDRFVITLNHTTRWWAG